MAKIFITGSSDGLGLLTAKALLAKGHEVVLHARNENRKRDTQKEVPGALILVADLSDMAQAIRLAGEVNALGSFDVIIHNAGVYNAPAEQILKVNVLAPYILTSLIAVPQRLIYLSSGMHREGRPDFSNYGDQGTPITYSDSKLHVLMLSMAVARLWPQVHANAVDPGWVPTKMGGHGAPDSLEKGYATQLWLADSNEQSATVSGHYFFHQKQWGCNPDAKDIKYQQQLLGSCEKLTGVPFPGTNGAQE